MLTLAITIGAIALAEVVAMIVVFFLRSLPYYQQVILDTAIMTVIIFPVLYLLTTRPLTRQIQQQSITEQSLQQTNQLLERMFSNVHVLVAYLDRKFNFVRVNQAYAQAENQLPEFFIRKNHFDLYPDAENEAIFRKVVETGESFTTIEKPFVNPGHPERGVTYWNWTLEPVKGNGNQVEGLVLSLIDVTRLMQRETINQARLRLMEYADAHSLDELLQFSLDQVETLSGSTIGFFHFIEADQKTIWLQGWSTNTLEKMCTASGKDSHYSVEKAGVWADCVHLRQTVVHNDYASLAHRKGTPEGHAPILREVSVPILRDGKIVAILGMGNKPSDYNANDVELISSLADYAWDVVERKRSEIYLRESKDKFRTLLDWTYDWEIWIDPHDSIQYASPACERITGYRPEEFIDNPQLLKQIVHPEDQELFKQHLIEGHDKSAGMLSLYFRVIARDGSERWIDHICRPLFGSDGRYLGRRVSNRDITEQRKNEKEIWEQDQKEKILTQAIQTMQVDIARDLHDSIGQNVSFLRLKLGYLAEADLEKIPDLHKEIRSLTRVVDESYDLIRGMLAVFQPQNSTDPMSLFTRYADQVEERSDFRINISHQGSQKWLSNHQIRQIFYIFREALSNIEKYAHASQVLISFNWQELTLVLKIFDNGVGFDHERVQSGEHFGLKFMQERSSLLGGTFGLRSELGKGTQISIQIPYAG